MQHNLFELTYSHGPRRRMEIRNRLIPRHDPYTLVDGRQEVAVPDLGARIRHMFAKYHVRWQCRIEGAKAVTQPGPYSRKWHRGRTCVHGENRLEVLDDIGMKRANDAQIIGKRTQVREQIANH